MKWEIESDQVESVLEKIWDLHDKLSDAIHSISRSHFVNSTKSIKNPDFFKNKPFFSDNVNVNGNGYVFVKDFDKEGNGSVVSEAKSLNSIRSALENLEDQLEFFHSMQVQQRVERDTALARLEQSRSRLILALRLAEHHGKSYSVIDEAINFVEDTNYFKPPEFPSNPNPTAPAEHSLQQREANTKSNILVRVLLSGFDSAKKTLQQDKMGGVLGNGALFAISMLALLHLHQMSDKDRQILGIGLKKSRIGKKLGRVEGSESSGGYLDVRLARG